MVRGHGGLALGRPLIDCGGCTYPRPFVQTADYINSIRKMKIATPPKAHAGRLHMYVQYTYLYCPDR